MLINPNNGLQQKRAIDGHMALGCGGSLGDCYTPFAIHSIDKRPLLPCAYAYTESKYTPCSANGPMMAPGAGRTTTCVRAPAVVFGILPVVDSHHACWFAIAFSPDLVASSLFPQTAPALYVVRHFLGIWKQATTW